MKSDGSNIRPERPQGPLTDIERSEFYLHEGERLAHMGSWSIRPDGVFDYWSPETFAIFDFDPAKGIPTVTQWLASEVSTEREQIEAALAQTRGKVSGRQGAAAILGMPASTLESKIRALRITNTPTKAPNEFQRNLTIERDKYANQTKHRILPWALGRRILLQ